MRKEKQKTWLRVFRMILLTLMTIALLVACGESAQPSQEPSGDDALSEFISDAVNGEVDAEVSITVNEGLEAQTLTTLVVPDADTPLIIEATGQSKSGKDFKVIFYGPAADLDLLDFAGQMRIKAQVSEIQGKQVLRGTAVAVEDASSNAKGLTTYPFMATNLTTRFEGPEAGTVFELRGNSDLRGVCGSSNISAMANLSGNGEAKGIMVGLFDETACKEGSSLSSSLQSLLHLTAIKTDMGILLSGPGNMGGTFAGKDIAFPVFALMVKEELPESVGFVNVEAADGVRVLNAAAAKEIIGFDSKTGSVAFKALKGNLVGLEVGDIIVTTPRPAAPNGFLRKVEAIEKQANQIVVTTSRAVLKDALKSADISLKRQFTAADYTQANAWEKGNVVYAQTDPNLAHQAGLSTQNLSLYEEINVPLDLLIYDFDDNEQTTDDQIRIEGDLTIAPALELALSCSLICTSPDFLARFDFVQNADIKFVADLTWEEEKTIKLITIPLPPITALFIVFTPEIVVSINARGEINVDVEFGVTQELDLAFGVEHDSKDGWSTISEYDDYLSFTEPEFSASVEARAGLEVEAAIMLYGMAGVSAGIEAYGEFFAGYPRDPAWELKFGLTGDIAAELDLIVWQEEYPATLFDFSTQIAKSENNPPEITDLRALSTCANGQVFRSLGNGPVRLDANTDDPEEGIGQGTVTWREGSTELGITTAGSRHSLDIDLSPGEHTITATVEDNDNASSTKTITIDVVKQCLNIGQPSVEILVPRTGPIIQTNRTTTLEAITGGGPLCCTITWESDIEGVLGQSDLSAYGTPSLDYVFTQNVPQTITATVELGGNSATDSFQLQALKQEKSADISSIGMQTASQSSNVYEDDNVTFSVTSSADLTWSSSNSADNLVVSGNSFAGQFNSSGPRTITVIARDDEGGFNSESFKVRVQSALARP